MAAKHATEVDGLVDQLVQQTLLSQTMTELPKPVELLLENTQRQAIANEALQALIDEAITDEALQAAYDAEFAGFQPQTEYNASHILVETEELAQEILELAQGGDDFAALAMEHSTGPSGPNGGQLGWFGEGQMVRPFEAAVVAMETGEVAGPVQTQFGWHIIKLNEMRDTAVPSLDEVRDDLIATLERHVADGEIAKLYDNAEVNIDTEIDPNAIMDLSIFDN